MCVQNKFYFYGNIVAYLNSLNEIKGKIKLTPALTGQFKSGQYK